MTDNGGPCCDEELDSEYNDELNGDDKPNQYNQFKFFLHL